MFFRSMRDVESREWRAGRMIAAPRQRVKARTPQAGPATQNVILVGETGWLSTPFARPPEGATRRRLAVHGVQRQRHAVGASPEREYVRSATLEEAGRRRSPYAQLASTSMFNPRVGIARRGAERSYPSLRGRARGLPRMCAMGFLHRECRCRERAPASSLQTGMSKRLLGLPPIGRYRKVPPGCGGCAGPDSN